MGQVQLGNTVRIHCSGTLQDGRMIGFTEENEPLEIQTGKGLLFPKLEQEILGMSAGEERTITLQPEEAFGPYREELMTEIALEEFTNRGIKPFEGLTLNVPAGEGKTIATKVTGITDQSVQLNGNHPLAGQPVTFSIQLLEIV